LQKRVEPKTELSALYAKWQEIAGELIAENSKPIRVSDGTVTVICTSSVWAGEIKMMSEMLIDKMNTEVQGFEVHTLNCLTGRLEESDDR